MAEKDDHVLDLITGHLCGELTPDQKNELQLWINACNHNKYLFEQLTDPANIKRDLQLMHRIDGQPPWLLIREGLPGIPLPLDFKVNNEPLNQQDLIDEPV